MRGRRRIGVDSEGYLIGKANKTPKTVCVTVCCDDGEAEIFKWSEARDLLFDILNTPSLELVLHHARFDLASFAAMDPELLALVFKAYDEDRIRCTMIREKLLALAKGELADEGDTGAKRNRKFSLAAIVLERFHVDLSGDKSSAKENKDGTYTLSGNKASWRLRYSELDNVPLRDWPEDAKKYALDDPRWNLAVYESQEAELAAGGGSELDGVIPDEMYQTRAAFWLYLMSAWGIRTDPVAVNALSSKLEAEWARINTVVRAGDVLKPQMKKGEMVWTKNMTAIRERVVSAFGGLENLPLSAWTPGGKDGKGKKEVSTSGDTLLACVNRPCLDWIEERERAVVELRVKEALPPLSEEALTSLAKTLCHSAADEFYPPEETYVVDTQGGALPPRERRVESRSAVADRIFNQIILDALSERGNTEKLLKTYVPMLFDGTQRPICANTNELVATGRTSSWDPNLQNPPRKGGVRECFVPRRGKLFAFCDYSFIELVTLAQVCLWKFGYSVLGDSINAGRDPHLVMAATMLGTTYEEVYNRRKDPDIKTARQNAKCFHPDTEALTRKGWKRIGDLVPGEEVAAAVPYEGGHVEILWEVPTNLNRRQATDLVHLKNKGIDLRITPEHRMLSFSLTTSGRGRRRCVGDPPPRIGPYKVITPEEMPRARYFPSAGILDNENGGVDVDERLLRLAVATQADGSYTDSGLVRFGFTKQRKIDRMRLLHGGECFESVSSQGVPTFKLGSTLSTKVRALLDEDKTVPWWWLNLTPRLRGIVLEEMEHWDCYTADHTEKGKNTKLTAKLYSTTLRKNADVLQALGVITGRKSRLTSAPAEGNKSELCSLSLKDHHLTRGGQMEAARIPYEGEVVCLSVPSTFVVVRDRGLPVITGQCVNFGRPGGLGDDKFVEYAYATYGVRMTKAEARKYKELWFETYPEMREYLAFFGKMSLGDREFTITQLPSGRVRGGCRYTSGANSLFQGLAADGIKRAGWNVSKECYLSDPYFDDVGPTALFGSRIVAMLHDELILEVPEEKAHEATERLSERMISGMHEVVPDIKVGTEAALARRWYKGAEPVFVDGRLVPWSPKEAVVVEKDVSPEALSWAHEYIGMDT